MQFIITFLEGMLSFLSSCMLPMLPIFFAYFVGETAENKENETGNRKTVMVALCFVLGFAIIFIAKGVSISGISRFLISNKMIVNVVCGVVFVLFGLNHFAIPALPLMKGMKKGELIMGRLSAFLFGVIYSIILIPCIGTYLGSAFTLASAPESALKGGTLLLCYCIGLGIPFVFSVILIDRFNAVIRTRKKIDKIIKYISGLFLVVVGLLTAFGMLNQVLAVFR